MSYLQDYFKDNQKARFFKAATASGMLMVIFFVVPNVMSLLTDKYNFGLEHYFATITKTYEQDIFYGGVMQIIYLFFAVFLVSMVYKFRPLSLFKKHGLVDEENSYYQSDEKSVKWGKLIAYAFPVMYMVNIAGGIIALIITKLSNNVGIAVPDVDMSLVNKDTLNTFLYFFRICVMAPFIEEFLMRGCMMKILKPFGNWFAIFTTAIMFGLLHGNIGQGIGAVAIGVFFGMIAVKTGSIYPSIILHGLNNLLVCLLGLFDKESFVALAANICVSALIILGILVVVFNYKTFKLKNNSTVSFKNSQCVKMYVLNPAVLLYLLCNIAVFVLSFVVKNRS